MLKGLVRPVGQPLKCGTKVQFLSLKIYHVALNSQTAGQQINDEEENTDGVANCTDICQVNGPLNLAGFHRFTLD
jgi:hypothetical protein